MFGGVLVNWATDHSVTVPLVGAVGGWRLAIFVVGLLGLPLALLMALTLREAPRRITTPAPPFADLGRYIMQIGRASCRESVCQYVSTSVVAVTFKKNKQVQHLYTKQSIK